MSSRYPTAVECEAAKQAGIEDPPHPADRFDDPMAAKLAGLPEQAEAKPPKLKHLGGSKSDRFNIDIANSVFAASWITSKEDRDRLVADVGHALAGINPQDEMEGMLAAQMVAAHAATMECFRRAMLQEQTLDGRAMNLAQGNKASRTYAMLLEALDRHRHKGGEQRVVVEHVHRHVHVHDHPLTVDAEPPGAGGPQKIGEQPHAPRLGNQFAPVAPLWSENPERGSLSGTSDAEREVPHARRSEQGRAKGTR